MSLGPESGPHGDEARVKGETVVAAQVIDMTAVSTKEEACVTVHPPC